jgi:NAD+ synthase
VTRPRALRPDPAAPEPDLSIDARETVRILTGFIASEVERTGHSRVVVGLSGGLDSAVATYLATAALGPASVTGVMMPFRDSHPDSVRDAESVVGAVGIAAERIDISPMVDAFGHALGKISRHRLGNIMARIRMTVLYDRSAEHRALVLGTSNKTEILLGYGTLHGDLASAVNPLGDLYKTQVRALAAHLGVPHAIRRKPPSADLWPDQSDEADLGFPYEALDRLLALLVDARVSRATAIASGFKGSMVDRVTRSVIGSQFKRRLPVIAKLSTRSLGWDFRYPRDWRS